MYYAVEQTPSSRVAFATHPKARRGRGVLFATAPAVIYLLVVSGLFALAVQDLSVWDLVKRTALLGGALAAALAAGCFALGRRMSDRVEATAEALSIHRTAALGPTRTERLPAGDIASVAIDASLRSLGADVLLVAVMKDGRRVSVAEGEPHSGQVRELAQRIADLLERPLDAPRFTSH